MERVQKNLSPDKPILREYFKKRRKILFKNNKEKSDLDMEIQSRLIMSAEYRAAESILIYMSRGFEIATQAVIYAALANNKTVAIPRCGNGGVMGFYRISSLSDVRPGRYDIAEPAEGCREFTPDAATLCVCPALCCDMRGYRLGFGAGYYDRYLIDFPGTVAALCYADSLIPRMNNEPFDIPMELIVTDSYIRHIQRGEIAD